MIINTTYSNSNRIFCEFSTNLFSFRCRKNSTVCKCNTDTRKENLHTTKNCRLTNAKIGTNQGSLNHRVPDLENCTCVRLEPKPDCPGCPDCAAGLRFRPQPIAYSNLTSPLHPPRRIDLRPLEFPVWPSYPPGNNITNYPDYPKVRSILGHYIISPPGCRKSPIFSHFF